jgi:outer membrane protein OmpA-like peptidoglycan-associated protein
VLAVAFHGCSGHVESDEGATAVPATSPSASALPAPSDIAVSAMSSLEPSGAEPAASLQPPGLAPSAAPSVLSPAAQPSPSVNLLSISRGALVRRWPSEIPIEGWPGAPLYDNTWRSGPGKNGPFEFVFELPEPATIERFGVALPTSAVPALQHVRFAVSSTSATDGFRDAGSFDVAGNAVGAQRVTLGQPLEARWVRVTLAAPSGSNVAFAGVSASGTVAQTTADVSIAGVWLIDDQPKVPNDPLYAGRNELPARVDASAGAQHYGILHVLQRGTEAQLVECHDGIFKTWHGYVHGSAIRLEAQDRSPGTATLDREGTTLVATDDSNTFPFIAFRIANAPACQPTLPVGAGKSVLVIGSGYPPGASAPVPWFRGYRFVPVFAPLFRTEDLAQADIAVLADTCDAMHVFSEWQKRAIVDFVAAGGKLLIHDSDACIRTDYSFLPYPFDTSAPGRSGTRGRNLFLAESDTLGSDTTDGAHLVDTKAYVDGIQDLGDANIVTTHDPHWCGHLFNTNRLNVNGFVQMYAHFGKGLIVYDGLDADDAAGNSQNQRVLRFELDQPTRGPLPCTQRVAGSFVVSPSQRRTYAAQTAQSLKFRLDVLAIQGWNGNVRLSVAGPPGSTWPSSVSPNVVSLRGGEERALVTIDVPGAAPAATYRFLVTGTNDVGLSARAEITLEGRHEPTIARQLSHAGRVAVYGIYFDFNSDRLRSASDPVLREIAAALKSNPAWDLTIEGHTDNVGDTAYNLDLSQRRARAVGQALVTRYGVAANRLSTVGYGASRPRASNATAAGRTLNRRVELVRR